MNKKIANSLAMGMLWAAAVITVATLGALLLYVFVNGISVISPAFIFTWPHGVNSEGGIWPTIVSTVYVTALAMVISTPVAVLAAVYLAEYAKQGRIVDAIRFAADSLASVPSIVMDMPYAVGLHRTALFAIAAMLFLFSMLLVASVRLLSRMRG